MSESEMNILVEKRECGMEQTGAYYSFFRLLMTLLANSINSSALHAQLIKGSSSNSCAVARCSGYASSPFGMSTSTFKARDKNALNASLQSSGCFTVGAGLVWISSRAYASRRRVAATFSGASW